MGWIDEEAVYESSACESNSQIIKTWIRVCDIWSRVVVIQRASMTSVLGIRRPKRGKAGKAMPMTSSKVARSNGNLERPWKGP